MVINDVERETHGPVPPYACIGEPLFYDAIKSMLKEGSLVLVKLKVLSHDFSSYRQTI